MISGATRSRRSSSSGHRFRARGAGLGFGRLGEDLEEELLVEARELAVGGDGEQLVGEVHEDAVVAGGVVGERGA